MNGISPSVVRGVCKGIGMGVFALMVSVGDAQAVTKTLLDTDSVQTATNKTFTAPVITGTVTGGATYSGVTLATPRFSGISSLGAYRFFHASGANNTFFGVNSGTTTKLGARLGVTCNTTIARTYAVTTRTAATSFVVTASAAPTTNPACLSYLMVN